MLTMDRESEKKDFAPVLSADEVVAKMRMGKKTTDEIRMGSLSVPVRVLSCDEVNLIRREAILQAAKVGGDETDKNLIIQKTTLKLASTLTANSAPFLGDKVLSLLTHDELGYLYEEYIRFMDNVNPSLEHISPERFRAVVDALKKNIISPKDCSLLQLRAICLAYVDLIQRQETPTSQLDS